MKRTKFAIMAAAILFIAAIVGYSIESKASVSDDLTKKQLKSCTVTSGGVIIQIGNCLLYTSRCV